MRGYQTFRMDRINWHKGGILVYIPVQDLTIDTSKEAEINGIKLHTNNQEIKIYNIYCPVDKQLSLDILEVPEDKCLVIGDLNSHSESWGYETSDRRVEDWQIDNNLLLLNNADDPPTFYSRRWLTTSSPDLAFATNDIQARTTRTVLKQLGGSDHRPVKLAVDLNYRPKESIILPRWNYRKADWDLYANKTDENTRNLKENPNINKMVKQLNEALLKAANESIPRGARKNYKPYWTDELSELDNKEVHEARETAETIPSVENNTFSLKKPQPDTRRYVFKQQERSGRRKQN